MGMDIVFIVVIKDLIDLNFDLSFLKLEVFSYLYSFEIIFLWELVFIFNDIKLVDFLINELFLYGFVSFSID